MKLYDEGYEQCSCFWGTKPAKLVQEAVALSKLSSNIKAFDVGCGEGKNSNFLAENGIFVIGIDESEIAINHANTLWKDSSALFLVNDMKKINGSDSSFDIIVSTGSIHCLENTDEVIMIMNKMKRLLRSGGLFVFSSFNNRHQEFQGHPLNFNPILLSHDFYLNQFNGFELIHESDKDLIDKHPNNEIEHIHSITRILARKID